MIASSVQKRITSTPLNQQLGPQLEVTGQYPKGHTSQSRSSTFFTAYLKRLYFPQVTPWRSSVGSGWRVSLIVQPKSAQSTCLFGSLIISGFV
jgi:hypothetical protein